MYGWGHIASLQDDHLKKIPTRTLDDIQIDWISDVRPKFENKTVLPDATDSHGQNVAYYLIRYHAVKCFDYLKDEIDFTLPINPAKENAFAFACAFQFKEQEILERIDQTGGKYMGLIDLEWYLNKNTYWDSGLINTIILKAPRDESRVSESYRNALVKHYANNSDIIKEITCRHGINLWQGPNPLSYLDYENSSTPAMVDEILKRYEIDDLDANGLTPLQSDLSARKVSILLSRGADLYAKGQQGMTPLENIALHHDDENNDLLKAVDPYIQPEKDAQKITQAVENLRNQGHCDAAKRLEKYAQVGGWHEPVISQQKITHVSVDGTLNKRITDVFNFASRERYTQLKDLTTEAETYLRENFDSEGANRNFWRTAAEHYIAHPQGAAEAPQLDEFLHSASNQKRAVSPIALTGQRRRLGPGADPANN